MQPTSPPLEGVGAAVAAPTFFRPEDNSGRRRERTVADDRRHASARLSQEVDDFIIIAASRVETDESAANSLKVDDCEADMVVDSTNTPASTP